ncbi:hypothetical protein [Pantoea sp. 18069]|uniref:hypothetical protein n=1 Tax=Pantoea sp. 18069 TaxID=2681415 RepID=UPI001357510E|nr:hypothetical protein [Pantoea sp. 18069]
MQPTAPAPTLAPLARGQTLTRAFAAGDELFCATGTLQLNSSALAGIDALPGLQWRLQAGQSWRAPAALRLQITALAGPAHLRCSPVAAPARPPAASDWRARAGALLRSWRTLRI